MEEEKKQLRKLLETSSFINSTLSIEEVLDRALKAAEEVMEAERSSIWEIDRETGELFFRVIRGGRKDSKIKSIRMKPGEGVVGRVAETGSPVIVKDVLSSSDWSHKVDDESDFITKSILSVPLKIKNSVIGVIQILNKRGGGEFDEKDLHHLELLSNQIAIALDNARLYEHQKELFLETAMTLATAAEKRDRYTGGHTRRVVEYSVAIAGSMGIEEDTLEHLKISAILHDIGKIGIPDAVLNKPGALDEEEHKIMMNHTIIGGEIIDPVEDLKPIKDGILYHHEKWDGSGYPYGIEGGRIPMQARIISVADTYDAMTTDRPYRKGLSAETALNEIINNSGSQFCPEVVKGFERAYEEGSIQEVSREVTADFPPPR